MADEVLSSKNTEADDIENEDQVLSEESPEVEKDEDPDLVGVDITEAQDPEDFDIEAFVSGLRPARRAVIIRNHELRYLIDKVKDVIESKRFAGLPTKDDQETLAEAIAEFLETGRTFVIGARSSEWIADLEKRLKKQGIDPVGQSKKLKAAQAKANFSKKTEQKMIADLQEMYRNYVAHRIAEQIVSPSGVTAEHIRRIGEVDEVAIQALFDTMEAANSDRRVTRDFSSQPSPQRRAG